MLNTYLSKVNDFVLFVTPDVSPHSRSGVPPDDSPSLLPEPYS